MQHSSPPSSPTRSTGPIRSPRKKARSSIDCLFIPSPSKRRSRTQERNNPVSPGKLGFGRMSLGSPGNTDSAQNFESLLSQARPSSPSRPPVSGEHSRRGRPRHSEEGSSAPLQQYLADSVNLDEDIAEYKLRQLEGIGLSVRLTLYNLRSVKAYLDDHRYIRVSGTKKRSWYCFTNTDYGDGRSSRPPIVLVNRFNCPYVMLIKSGQHGYTYMPEHSLAQLTKLGAFLLLAIDGNNVRIGADFNIDMRSKYIGVYRAHDGKHALSAQGWAKLPPIAKDVAVHAISNQNNLAEDDVRRELDAGHRQLRLVLLQFSNHAMKFRNKMNEIEGKTQSTARAHVVPRVIPPRSEIEALMRADDKHAGDARMKSS